MAKIFSGDESKQFWAAVNASPDSDILYDYGLKAQELETENAALQTCGTCGEPLSRDCPHCKKLWAS